MSTYNKLMPFVALASIAFGLLTAWLFDGTAMEGFLSGLVFFTYLESAAYRSYVKP